MKRTLTLAVVAVLALAIATTPATGVPGPDPQNAPNDFQIFITGTHLGETEMFEELNFSRANGWDFGDREAYRCAYVEYIVGGQIQFEISFERLAVPGHEGNYIVINDKDGWESGEGGFPDSSDNCGMPPGAGPRSHDGSPMVPGGASFTVHKGGAPLVTYNLPATTAVNAESFWSVGDEPGEAYLWYVEEGEADDAVLRALIIPVAEDVTLSAGPPPPPPTPDPSPSPTPPPPGPPENHRSSVTLRLSGHLRATGFVSIAGGAVECGVGRTVIVERKNHGSWNNVARELSAGSGFYSETPRDRTGTYRARVVPMTLANGDTCSGDVSPPEVHNHRR
ncbi:MAG TPA: hypothetical protein VIC58_12690 [Actinomycetota bacterium]|jgi:hypothetical protein